MKILVISDTHKKLNTAIKVIEMVKPDRVLHLGDHALDAEDLQSIFDKIIFDYVCGNCDFNDYDTPKDKIITLMGKRIWLTHGHLYGVKYSTEHIHRLSVERDVDVALFGHSHIPYLGYEGNRIIMNPGSISEPRGGSSPSFGVLEIDSKGALHPTLKKIKK